MRYATLTVVCGRRASGKTNKTLTALYKAVHNGRKVLIADFMDEFGNYIYRPGDPAHAIKPIFLKDVLRFTVQTKPEIVRIRPFHDNGVRMSDNEKQEALYKILKTYRNGILLVEDVNVYISDNAPNDIIGSLATLRQAGVDLIMHYQLIQKAANPKILGMANYIRLHKTNDEVARFKDRFLDKTDIMTVAQIIVNNRYKYGHSKNVNDETGKYFSVTVDIYSNKIRGIFTKEEAHYAVEEFISKNAAITINQELLRKDRHGKKIYSSYQQAYENIETQMMQDFFMF